MGAVVSTLSGVLTSPAGSLVGWIALCVGGGFLGAISTTEQVKTWYKTIKKPSWTPPDVLFGPVWTILYTLMGISAWKVWSLGGFAKHSLALKLFLGQLGINFAWSPLFFGAHQIGLAAVEITAMWASIVATIFEFRKASPAAAALLLPYLVWVSYATALNWTIWKLNRSSDSAEEPKKAQ